MAKSNALFKIVISSLIVISLTVSPCFSAGAVPGEGDLDLYKGVIAGYAIVSGMEFQSWREVNHFAEDFFKKIIEEQTPEQMNFMSKILYSDFADFDFYFLRFNSRPATLQAFVSAVESTYNIDLNPDSESFTDNFNIDKLLAMPSISAPFDTSVSSNSATNYGIIYNLGNRVAINKTGLNLISTNSRGISLYAYFSNDDKISYMFKLGEYYIKIRPKFDTTVSETMYIQPCVLFKNNGAVSSTSSSGRGVYISDFLNSKAFNISGSYISYDSSITDIIGTSYGAITYGYAIYNENGYLLGVSYLNGIASQDFMYNTDPVALHDDVSLGNNNPTYSDLFYFDSFLSNIYSSTVDNNVLYYDVNMRDIYLYNSNYTFTPLNYNFTAQIKIPSNESNIISHSNPVTVSRFAVTLFSEALGLTNYVIGVQIQPAMNIIIDKAYLQDSSSLFNQLLEKEQVIRVPYNMDSLDTDSPDQEITPTPPSIEDTDTPIGDISDSSQQVGDNLNGTSGSIDDLGNGLLVPDVDFDNTIDLIPDEGKNSIDSFASLVLSPIMNYPIVTSLLLCLLGFSAVKLLLYGTGKD